MNPKFLFSFFLLVSSFQLLQSQSIVDTTLVWQYSYYNPLSLDIQLRFQESIERNGKEYRKLYRAFEPEFNEWESTGYAFRQEDKKVFFIQGFASDPVDEFLYYDFGLHIGDSIYIHQCNDYTAVTMIDSVVLNNGEKHLRIGYPNFFYGSIDYWIEGIGSTVHLYEDGHYCFWDLGSRLHCFYREGQFEFGFESVCDLYSSTSEDHAEVSFSMTTVVSDKVVIHSKIPHQTVVTMYDMSGRIVRAASEVVTDVIEVGSLPAGIYIAHFQNEKARWTVRFAKA